MMNKSCYLAWVFANENIKQREIWEGVNEYFTKLIPNTTCCILEKAVSDYQTDDTRGISVVDTKLRKDRWVE